MLALLHIMHRCLFWYFDGSNRERRERQARESFPGKRCPSHLLEDLCGPLLSELLAAAVAGEGLAIGLRPPRELALHIRSCRERRFRGLHGEE